MLLSEMIQVKMDTEFGVEMFDGKFKFMQRSGHERLYHKSGSGDWGAVTAAWMLYGVIESASSGIIHLPPPLTDEQREQLRAIWTLGYRSLAKDKYGSVYAYETKPYKKVRDTWLYDDGDLYLCCTKSTKCLAPLASWSDHEPYDIGKALGVGNEQGRSGRRIECYAL